MTVPGTLLKVLLALAVGRSVYLTLPRAELAAFYIRQIADALVFGGIEVAPRTSGGLATIGGHYGRLYVLHENDESWRRLVRGAIVDLVWAPLGISDAEVFAHLSHRVAMADGEILEGEQ